MSDHGVKFAKVVAGHGCIHVVLNVIIHLPVEKPDNWMKIERAATKAEIIHVVLEPDMLGIVAKEKQP